jgi:hypothetical protein
MGIVKNMSNMVYHSTSGISSSAVKSVYKKSLAHWKGEKRTQTAAFTMGTAVHALLLEEDKNLVHKGPKTRRSKAFEEKESKLKEDEVLLTEVEYNTAKKIARTTLSNKDCEKFLRHKDRENEVSVFAECPRTGLMLKTRPDLMIKSEKTVFDVKTTQDASPLGFSNECFRYAYDIQSAFYIYVCKLAGLDVSEFKFIAVEKTAPYVSHVHVVSEDLLANATERMHRTLGIIASAQDQETYDTGWGDYSIIELPKWL